MSDRNSESYGARIQVIALGIGVLTCILAILAGLGMIFSGLIGTGLATIALGIIFSFVIHAFLMGFGEMVEDIHYIRRSNATQAEYFDWLVQQRQKKNNP